MNWRTLDRFSRLMVAVAGLALVLFTWLGVFKAGQVVSAWLALDTPFNWFWPVSGKFLALDFIAMLAFGALGIMAGNKSDKLRWRPLVPVMVKLWVSPIPSRSE